MAEHNANRQRDPDDLVAEAKARWQPIKTYCLFSGGGDSGVLAHRLREHYDTLLYIDTGTAIPTVEKIVGVEDHVRASATLLDKPLAIRRSGDSYRTMVLGDERWWKRYRAAARSRPSLTVEQMIAEDQRAGRTASKVFGQAPRGFPGPGQHGKAYSRLKERRIEEILRETKRGCSRFSTVLFLSGIRRAESRRRSRREPLTERGSAKFCSPLIDWTAEQMAAYRARFDLPLSDVAALTHRSGECNCGAFAQAEEERSLMRTFWPDWWAEVIEALEEEAIALGIRWCRWGGFDLEGNRASGSGRSGGLLCSNCPTRSLDSGHRGERRRAGASDNGASHPRRQREGL
ncbi:MAG TPA: phosphoadenosine phosphosulfate reductase family protein [Solirubrobacterales bacterium]|nr:phosphoadenosine phosphosulfate reductase family protein [Solirubrobacterales bacterium]